MTGLYLFLSLNMPEHLTLAGPCYRLVGVSEKEYEKETIFSWYGLLATKFKAPAPKRLQHVNATYRNIVGRNKFAQTELSIWHWVRVRALSSFFPKFCSWAFLIQETVNSLLLVFSGFWLLLIHFSSFKTSEKRGNIPILSNTLNHWTLMADRVQWFSQSDYRLQR